MITGSDLTNIDFILSLQESITNQPKERTGLITKLRSKIHEELNKIEIKIKK